MRILIHTQYFPPEIGAPQNRLFELACELTALGHNVFVLTAMPNYPTGHIFPGYGGIFRKEQVDNVIIYRTYIYPTQKSALIPRLLNYFSFVLSSFLVGLFLPQVDIVFTESPPLFLGISGYLLSRIKRAKWIFNVADLWPSSAVELGVIKQGSLPHRISASLEAFFYRKACLVTGQSKTILHNITCRYRDTKTYHLSNGVQLDRYPVQVRSSPSDGILCIMYAGLHGLAQGLDQILSAAKLLEDYPFRFVFVGDGPCKKALMVQSAELNLNNVEFREPVLRDDIPSTLAKADILIVPLKVQLTGAVPSKLYEAMAASKPVILIAESEAAEIVLESGCGVVVKPDDTQALADAVKSLYLKPDDRMVMGRNGRNFVEKWFDRKAIARDFSKYLMQFSDQLKAIRKVNNDVDT